MTRQNDKTVYLPAPFEAYKGNDPNIFISYSHKDRNRVYPELLRLHNLGYRIWYDEGVAPGSLFSSEIAGAIEKSTITIVFISPHSIKSEHVEKEIHFASEKGKTILPIYIVETEPEGGLALQLSGMQAIRKYRMIEETYNRTIEKILPPTVMERFGEDNKTSAPTMLLNRVNSETAPPSASSQVKPKEYKYHVYITFKNLDEDGDPTHDSIHARKLYKFLTGKGINVFHNIITTEEMDTESSGDVIREALDSSQVMIVVGTSPENVTTPKSREEWERFDSLLHKGSIPGGLLISYIKGFNKSELPETLRKHEVIVEGFDSWERLFHLISNTIGLDEPDSEQEPDIKKLIEKGETLWLCRLTGDGPEQVSISPGEVLRVGRRNENDIVLNLTQVSRNHAEITYSKEGIFVEDLKSANGSFVNKKKVSWQELQLGDVIKFDVISYELRTAPGIEKPANA